MELGAAAAAPAASPRARHTLSGDDDAEEPSPTRRRLGGLEVGCPLALLKHSVEILQALATAASNASDVRVPKKDVDRLYKYNDGGRWCRFFKADTIDSPVPRGCADKSSAGADYGKYWFTRAGVDYLDALRRDTHEDLDDASDDQAPRSSISWFSPLSPGAPRSSPAATAGQTDVPRVPHASARIPRGQKKKKFTVEMPPRRRKRRGRVVYRRPNAQLSGSIEIAKMDLCSEGGDRRGIPPAF